MIVRASRNSEYQFIPNGTEYKDLLRVFGDLVKRAPNGFTMAAYDQVPLFVVQGAEYFGATAASTRSFDNRQQALDFLQLSINLGDSNIIDISKGCRLPAGARVSGGTMGTSVNHIPQLYSIINGNEIITGFNGEYNFKSRLWWGQIDFVRVNDLWNV